jgi:hypothetical protein
MKSYLSAIGGNGVIPLYRSPRALVAAIAAASQNAGPGALLLALKGRQFTGKYPSVQPF